MIPEQIHAAWLLLASFGVGGLLLAFGLGVGVGAWMMKRHAEAALATTERACLRVHETAHPQCGTCGGQLEDVFENTGDRVRREFD